MSGHAKRQAEPVPELVSTLRRSLVTLRHRRLGPAIGGPEAAWSGHWTAIVLSSVLVFACFFTVGRVTRGGGSASGEATSGTPSTLGAAAQGAAVPAELSGGSPVSASTPVAIAAKPRPRRARVSPRPRVITPLLSASPPASSGSVRDARPATSTPVIAAPVRSGAPSTPTAPASGAPSATKPSPGAGGSRTPGAGTGGGAVAPPSRSTNSSSPAAGGGSFDSSE